MGDVIENLRENLKLAIKQKLAKDREVNRLRSEEHSLCYEYSSVSAEIEDLTQNLEELKEDIIKVNNQIALVEICTASEKSKVDHHIKTIRSHQDGFDKFNLREQELISIQNDRVKDEEAAVLEVEKQKEKEMQELTDKQAIEIAVIEEESLNLERECIVLKKRNNAIMLKLRRKLVETEETRRKLIKRNESNF